MKQLVSGTLNLLALLLLIWGPLGGVLSAQATAGWMVKPAWVRAHEEFLASDAMRGRGSATHDEEVAATYVASEFLGYGLQPAPGMDGFVQSAAIVAPELDGHAELRSGKVVLSEGADFTLLTSSRKGVSGPLIRVDAAMAAGAKVPTGAVVLLSGAGDGDGGIRLAQILGSAGAAAVLIEDGPGSESFYTMAGGKTRVPVRLADGRDRPARVTALALDRAALAQFASVRDGETVSLAVQAAPLNLQRSLTRKTFNAIGWLPGQDPGAGTILLTAHLDHLGVGKAVDGDAIWNGANDDAAGTTAVLELAHALAAGPRLRRSVLFVCYGSEEAGELGSTYFGEHPPVPLKSLVANLEFEMIGNQDPKMPNGVLLLTGWDRSNLGPTLKAHGALLGPDPYPEQHFFERSDNYALALKGVVAHTAAGWGTPPTYHQPDDDIDHLDLPFMTRAIQSLVVPVRWLASSGFVPQWKTGGQPVGDR